MIFMSENLLQRKRSYSQLPESATPTELESFVSSGFFFTTLWFLPEQFWTPGLKRDRLGQGHFYQLWRCSWDPERYHISFPSGSACRDDGFSHVHSSVSQQRGHLSDQGSWADLSPAAEMTMSFAGWDTEGLVPQGLSWGQVTRWCFFRTTRMDCKRWAPPECDYRNNCLMLLLWLILKPSLSVSIDYFGRLAAHISQKNLSAEWLRDRFLTGTLNHRTVAKHLLTVETSKLGASYVSLW